ncbi:hypothetical protein [Couchioplanes azureus]|uniref:hypothetical protein n=1 Tax=Couchioplanes caeruleus TaxID=56438 RepID=UPI00167117B2|nr:hypothetical protein [Couchioplanes caeruleus]GGQ86548.1 hypothetical protein GCM10010166_65820 [Couchioplanes caeruleus subsp. azureus]
MTQEKHHPDESNRYFAAISNVDEAGGRGDRHSLAGVVTAVRLSRATMRNIRQNLFFAIAYNALGIPIAVRPQVHTAAPDTLHGGSPAITGEQLVDPVCGMTVDPTPGACGRRPDGTAVRLCSAHCVAAFAADPGRDRRTAAASNRTHA